MGMDGENGFVESDELHEYCNRFTEEDLEKLYDYTIVYT